MLKKPVAKTPAKKTVAKKPMMQKGGSNLKEFRKKGFESKSYMAPGSTNYTDKQFAADKKGNLTTTTNSLKHGKTVGGDMIPYFPSRRTSLDTTGYAKGKKEFTVKTGVNDGQMRVGNANPYSETKTTISRSEVPKTIANMKRGTGPDLVKKSEANKRKVSANTAKVEANKKKVQDNAIKVKAAKKAVPKTALPKAQKGWSVDDPYKRGVMGAGASATKTTDRKVGGLGVIKGGTKTKTISAGGIYPGAKGSITTRKTNNKGQVTGSRTREISKDRANKMINRRRG